MLYLVFKTCFIGFFNLGHGLVKLNYQITVFLLVCCQPYSDGNIPKWMVWGILEFLPFLFPLFPSKSLGDV